MNVHFQHKRKLTFLLAMLLFISVIFISTPPLTAKADGNGTGQDDNTGLTDQSDSGHDYPSSNKTGWLVYLTDTNGNLVSGVTFVSANNKLPNGYNSYYLTTRIGNAYPDFNNLYTNAEWGAPMDSNGNGRGAIIKQEIAFSSNYSGGIRSNAYFVVEKYLGTTAYELFYNNPDDTYLILETCAWHELFTGSYAGNYVVVSASGVVAMERDSGMNSKSDSHVGWMDNCRLQISCQLDKDWPGLPTAPGSVTNGITADNRLDYNTIESYGTGLIAIRGTEALLGNMGGDFTHTWDSVNHPTNEDKAPDPTEDNPDIPSNDLIYTIIKSYRIKDGSGNYTDRGTYTRTQTVASILIEDEPLGDGKNYKVIGWKHSSTSKPSGLTALNWESSVPPSIGETGTEAGFTTLDTNHKYLYVLLEATEDGVADYNYNLPQSSITRRINYSTPDYALGNMSTKLNTYQFSFTIGAHTTSCTGHTWKHSDNDSSCDNYHTDSTYGNCDCLGEHTHLTV